jgi:hypothetical protein
MKKILATAALAAAVGATALVPAPALAGAAPPAQKGNTSLAEVLGADGVKFDQSWNDFDVVEAAVYAVLDAKPASPVGLLADGDVRLTALVPTDKAFRVLVKDLTGRKLNNEKMVFRKVASLGIDTVETVLLYHVVPGATLDSKKVVAADGATVPTALAGAGVTVKVKGSTIKLIDLDHDDFNPKVVVADINKGNKQIAHAINKVLRPADL